MFHSFGIKLPGHVVTACPLSSNVKVKLSMSVKEYFKLKKVTKQALTFQWFWKLSSKCCLQFMCFVRVLYILVTMLENVSGLSN